jgi:hypothetical protein
VPFQKYIYIIIPPVLFLTLRSGINTNVPLEEELYLFSAHYDPFHDQQPRAASEKLVEITDVS